MSPPGIRLGYSVSEEIYMSRVLKAILKDESGATAIEYGLIAALISVTLIAGATSLGTEIGNTLNDIKDKVSAATP